MTQRINKPYWLFAFLLFYSCKAYKTNQLPDQFEWKVQWYNKLMDEYHPYRKAIKDSLCPLDTRDYYIDYAKKIYSIRDYPAGIVFKTIYDYARSNKIEYDSIIMINDWRSDMDPIEYSCPYTFVSYKNGDNTVYIAIGLDYCEEVNYVSKIKPEAWFIHMLLSTDFEMGCDYGYMSYTILDKKGKSRVAKIVINPDGTRPRGD
jgi:hypothetical protein